MPGVATISVVFVVVETVYYKLNNLACWLPCFPLNTNTVCSDIEDSTDWAKVSMNETGSDSLMTIDAITYFSSDFLSSKNALTFSPTNSSSSEDSIANVVETVSNSCSKRVVSHSCVTCVNY